MNAIEKAQTLMDRAAAQGCDEARDLARRAWDEFDRARDFRRIRNQHPIAKAAHAKGARLLKKAEKHLGTEAVRGA